MRLVLQRVLSSSVWIDNVEVSRIARGILILFGALKDDKPVEATYFAEKVARLRMFPDEKGKMNKSCLEIGGEVLVVSQFTLAANCSRGNRPDFEQAAEYVVAEFLYNFFIGELKRMGLKVGVGEFGADMRVDIQNEGPVTFILEKQFLG